MMQRAADDPGRVVRTSGVGPFKTTGQKVCIAVGLLLVLCGGGVVLTLSCCWRPEVSKPVPVVPPAPPSEELPTTEPVVPPAPGSVELPTTVPVRLAQGEPRLTIVSAGVGRWQGIAPASWELPPGAGPWDVEASGGMLKIGGTVVPDATARFTSEGGTFQLGEAAYRGNLIVEANPGKGLIATELVELEDYLRGVVGSEMPPTWPLQAQMAQAVAARTYAVYKLLDASKGPPCLKLLDLAYQGIGAENSNADRAVALTEGTVLNYNGAVFPTYFHSTCGGVTSSPQTVFQEPPIAPLSSVECSWCTDSPCYRWSVSLSAADIAAKISAWGVRKVYTISLMDADGAGRPAYVLINGVKKMPANDFRMAVGSRVLKSTLMTVSRRGKTFRFEGRGWGHGVGMCQWGAHGMAMEGKSWDEILKHYYPGAEIIHTSKEQ